MKTGKIAPQNVTASKASEVNASKEIIATRAISNTTGGGATDILDRQGVQAEITAFGSSALRMIYKTGTAAPAGNGEITGDTTDLSTLTELRVYETDIGGYSTLWLLGKDIFKGCIIKLVSTDYTKYVIFSVNSIAVDSGAYRTIKCSLIETNTSYASLIEENVTMIIDSNIGVQKDYEFYAFWNNNITVKAYATRIVLYDDYNRPYVATDIPSIGARTADITVSGDGGLDTGTEASDTWYWVWLISKGDGTDTSIILSLSPTSPTMPSGYIYKRLVSIVRNNSSGNFVPYSQYGNDYFYTGVTVLKNGSFTTGAWTALNPTTVVPNEPDRIVSSMTIHTQDSDYVGLTQAVSTGQGGIYWTCDADAVATTFGGLFTSTAKHCTVKLPLLLGNANIYYFVSNASTIMNCTGFTMRLGFE